jgi:hypothetical protein
MNRRIPSYATRLALITGALVSASAFADAQTSPGNAKIAEQVVATSGSSIKFLVSDSGAHVATISRKGSRFVVLMDGVEGPPFDEILNNGEVVLTPDGTRFAYAGRNGQEYVVMVDGKELGRGSATGGGMTPVSQLWFTPNNRHVYFVAAKPDPSTSNVTYNVIFDGVAGPPSAEAPVVVPSPDGDRFAYLIKAPVTRDRWTLVVDGKPAAYVGGDPRFSADGKTLFTKMNTTVQNRSAVQLLANGTPIVRAEEARVWIPPKGDRIVVVIFRSGAQLLVVGGRPVPGGECQNVDTVIFSKDGQHYGAICSTPQYTKALIVDGKRMREYLGISNVRFTADGRPVYHVTHAQRQFIVVGEEESDAYAGIHDLSARVVGNHVVFAGYDDAGARTVSIDGKKTTHDRRFDVTALTLSSDGSRFAYAMGGANSERLVLDGVEQRGLIFPFSFLRNGGATARIAFSPDAKYVAHAATLEGDNTKRGIALNGKFVPVRTGDIVDRVTFTPDNKHLYWIAREPNAPVLTIYLDGREVSKIDMGGGNMRMAMGATPEHAYWVMGSDGTVTVVAQVGNALKRIRITPTGTSDVTSLMAAGQSLK